MREREKKKKKKRKMRKKMEKDGGSLVLARTTAVLTKATKVRESSISPMWRFRGWRTWKISWRNWNKGWIHYDNINR
ncbi:MAG: hypothetical protein ATN35_11775 [Epulopiscium sp. Nele67-Bin004]|nr:MAG: hypothetical protein ATN35_11775 [Epulopiscium sp. Nele67-Bin004]